MMTGNYTREDTIYNLKNHAARSYRV